MAGTGSRKSYNTLYDQVKYSIGDASAELY